VRPWVLTWIRCCIATAAALTSSATVRTPPWPIRIVCPWARRTTPCSIWRRRPT